MFAWQVFDQKTVHLLRDEYRIPRTTKERSDTLEALAARLEGVDAKGFLDTVRAFNAAARPNVPFNPNIHDGLRTSGLPIDKSNWAQRIDTPPYEAYGVTTGITFTFGGLKITNDAEVEDVTRRVIPAMAFFLLSGSAMRRFSFALAIKHGRFAHKSMHLWVRSTPR